MRYSVAGRAGAVLFDVIYSPELPATWTGPVREAVENGSLNFYLKAEIRQAGRYIVTGRVDDAKGKPFALVTFNDLLGAGPNEVKLTMFGKLMRDQEAALPLTLRDVDGYLLKENTDPDRALMPRLEGKAFAGKPHPLTRVLRRRMAKRGAQPLPGRVRQGPGARPERAGRVRSRRAAAEKRLRRGAAGEPLSSRVVHIHSTSWETNMNKMMRLVVVLSLFLTSAIASQAGATNYSLWINGRGSGGAVGNYNDFSYWGPARSTPASTRKRSTGTATTASPRRTARCATRSTASAPARTGATSPPSAPATR